MNPNQTGTPYLAHGVATINGENVWFEDREISRDPTLGILVERRTQDTGKILSTYFLPQDFVERDMERPSKSIRQLWLRRKARLKNCQIWKPGTPFETLPNADKR